MKKLSFFLTLALFFTSCTENKKEMTLVQIMMVNTEPFQADAFFTTTDSISMDDDFKDKILDKSSKSIPHTFSVVKKYRFIEQVNFNDLLSEEKHGPKPIVCTKPEEALSLIKGILQIKPWVSCEEGFFFCFSGGELFAIRIKNKSNHIFLSCYGKERQPYGPGGWEMFSN